MSIISVAMATYNGEKYIEEQLKSILSQSLKPDEIIVYDDVSSDNTVLLIKNIMEISPVKIKLYINKYNLGFINNFRQAIMRSTGDYIFLCDQDDIWETDKIEKIIGVMKREDASMACTGIRLIDKSGKMIMNTKRFKSESIQGYEEWTSQYYKISLKQLVWGNFSPGCTYCFDKRVAEVYKKIENCEVPHDFQLFLIASNMDRAIYIDEPLVRYRLHDNNTVGVGNKQKKQKRYLKPRNIRFLDELEKIQPINHKVYIYMVLYLRLPMFRSQIIHKFKLRNIIDMEKMQGQKEIV